MVPHIERMKKELKKLNKKILSAAKAVEAGDSGDFPDVERAQVDLLGAQVLAMATYANILELRINNDTRIELEKK